VPDWGCWGWQQGWAELAAWTWFVVWRLQCGKLSFALSLLSWFTAFGANLIELQQKKGEGREGSLMAFLFPFDTQK